MRWPGQILVGSRVLEELRKKYFVQVVLKDEHLIEINITPAPPKTSSSVRLDIKGGDIVGKLERELREGDVSSFSIEIEARLAFSGEYSPVTIYVNF